MSETRGIRLGILKRLPSDDTLSAGGDGGGLCMCTVILGLLQWEWAASLPLLLPHAVIIYTDCAYIYDIYNANDSKRMAWQDPIAAAFSRSRKRMANLMGSLRRVESLSDFSRSRKRMTWQDLIAARSRRGERFFAFSRSRKRIAWHCLFLLR